MNEKISALTLTTLQTGDAIPIARSGANFKVDVQASINAASANALQKPNNLSDVANQQTALNNVTNISAATNEYVLTKDTVTGNAIFKPSVGNTTNITFTNSSTITVDHNKGYNPLVQIIDTTNNMIDGQIYYPTLNRFIVYFNINLTGIIIYS